MSGSASPGPSATPRSGAPTPTEPAGAATQGSDFVNSPTLAALRELVKNYGEPPGAKFARLRIPALGVDAPVGSALVGSDGVMTAPHNPVEVTWYDLALWAGMGGAPGGGGNAIFSGHVNYAYNVPYANDRYYRGPAIFAGLADLAPGDVIEVDYQGRTLRYAVKWVKRFPDALDDWTPVWSRDAAVDSITLYTCAGTFDAVTRNYSDRLVVRAERVF